MKNYSAWNIIPLSSTALPAETFLRHLVAWAILAPNSHNSQPWCFVVTPRERRVTISLDYMRVLPASDAQGREAHVSIGCAAAYLWSAARAYGYEARIAYDAANHPGGPITIQIPEWPTWRRRNALFDAMRGRRSNRGPYDPHRRVPELLVERCVGFANDAGVRFSAIVDRMTCRALAAMLYAAERIVTGHDAFRRELGRYILTNDDAAPFGMPGHNFGLNDEEAKTVAAALNADTPFDKRIAHRLAAASYRGMASAPLVGVVSIPENTPAYWLKAGFAFGRMAIAAEMSRVATAINAAFVEAPPFNFALRLRLASKWRPTVVFRAGYASESRPHAPRINAGDVIEIAE